MSSPRERQLAEGIKNKLIAIQKSEQIYKGLSKWEKRTMSLDEKEIESVSTKIAEKVEKYAKIVEKKTGHQPTPAQIMAKIQGEIRKI